MRDRLRLESYERLRRAYEAEPEDSVAALRYRARRARLGAAAPYLGEPDAVLAWFIEGLRSEDVLTRRLSAFRISRLGAEAELAMPALLLALSDGNAGVRAAAARALGGLGIIAASTAPDLVDALRDVDGGVRTCAAEALQSVGGVGVAVQRCILDLRGAPASTKHSAVLALGQLGPPARRAKLALVECLGDPNAALRINVIWALGRVVPDADELAPLMEALLADPSSEVRQRALRFLARLGPRAGSSQPRLLAALEDRSRLVRQAAAQALRAIDARGEELAWRLARAVQDEDLAVRHAAALALESAVPDCKGLEVCLLSAIRDPSAVLRDWAHRMLRRGPPARAEFLVEELLNLAETSSPATRRGALTALGILGAAAGDAAPQLLAILDRRGHDSELARALVATLGELGNEAAVPVFMGMVEKRIFFRRELVEALGRLGPVAREAAPLLRKLAADRFLSSAMRSCIALALRRIEGQPFDSGRRSRVA